MNNEEFQKLVLEQLSKINARLDNIEGQVKKSTDFIGVLLHRTEELNAQLHNVSANIDKLCGQGNNLETKVNNLEIKINGLETKFDALQTQVSTIQTNMATKEDITRIEYKVSVLNNRLLDQEYEIHRLKAAR